MYFRILDLFCGAGGFSYGMHKNEHFKTVVAVDFNAQAAHTFKMNMPDASVIVGDVTNRDVKTRIISESRQRGVNMIIGGPPCQGFSLKGKKMGIEDPRNFLFREYLGFVETLRPEIFVIENVKTLLSSAKGWFKNEILSHIGRLGYKVSYGVLNARNFGVPQSRERAIFICSKSTFIPLPTGNDIVVTVRDAIEDLSYLNSGEGDFEADYVTVPSSDYQILMRNESRKLYNHKASAHSELAIHKLSLIPPESGKEHLPAELLGRQRFSTTWGRLAWDKVSPTIDTRFDTPSNGTNSHPYLHRAITPREAARLQSFDDRFIFWGSKFYIRSQIGNAVPPLMAKAIADIIVETLMSDSEFILRSTLFENSLSVDLRKAKGVFYTDLSLANTIVDFLDIPVGASVLDPCCGVGSFLYALRQAGVHKLAGIEIDRNAVQVCSDLTGIASVFHLDSIGPSGVSTLRSLGNEAFDYIVGNPPYVPLVNGSTFDSDSDFQKKVASSGNNLFVGAIYRAFELCKKGGVVSVVVPKNVLHVPAYAELRQFLLRETTLMSVVELGIHFKSVRGEQIVLTCRNEPCPSGNMVKFYTHSKGDITFLSEFSQELYSDKIIVFTSKEEPHIYSRLKKLRPLLVDLCISPIRRGRSKENAVRGKNVRKFGIRGIDLSESGGQIFIQNIFSAESGIIASYGSNLEAGETITVLNLVDPITAKYVLGLLHSRLLNYYLIRFIFNNSRLTIHTDAKYLNNLPIISDTAYRDEVLKYVDFLEKKEYMSEEWLVAYDKLNDIVYDIYGISDDDKVYIESEMCKIFSSKWYPQKSTQPWQTTA